MRAWPGGRLGPRILTLLLCVAAGCVGLRHHTNRRESGTFKDDLNLHTGGYSRHFNFHIPLGYDPARPCPVVIVLHGAFSTAREMEQGSGWSQLADREGFMVIYPEGIGILGYLQHWNAGHCCGKAAKDQWDDVAFLDAVIQEMGRHYAIDRQRVYMVGLSNGGMLAYRYAAERSGTLAAVAAVAGAIGSQATPDQPEWLLPPPAGPISVYIMHGTADEAIPIVGGRPVGRSGQREYRPVSDAAGFWIAANHCDQGPEWESSSGGWVSEEFWTDINGQTEVRVCRILNWGHQWPGGPYTEWLPEDHPLKDFDAASRIWHFFQQHPKPEAKTPRP